MRIHEFHAMVAGYARANGGADDAPSDESFLRALAAEKRKALH